MILATVLNVSNEYQLAQALWFQKQAVARGHDVTCLTNHPRPAGLKHARLVYPWPTWWAKMELFNPEGTLGAEDLLYFDLDTVLVGSLKPIVDAVWREQEPGIFTPLDSMVALSDFYHEQDGRDLLASGMMWIPASIKARVWEVWMSGWQRHLNKSRGVGQVGDQGFLNEVVGTDALRWQKVCPDKVLSYKCHVAGPTDVGYHGARSKGDGSIPLDTEVVCFHGKPRPWELISKLPWIPK